MPPRRPSPARSTTALPSLAAALAGAASLDGCAPVECGSQRIDEVAQHGPRGAEALSNGRLADGLREIAVAVGARAHETTRHEPRALGGAPLPVTVTPPAPPPGGIRPAGPEGHDPPRPPTPPQNPGAVEGGIRPVRPTRPTPPPGRGALRGDVISVSPAPVD